MKGKLKGLKAQVIPFTICKRWNYLMPSCIQVWLWLLIFNAKPLLIKMLLFFLFVYLTLFKLNHNIEHILFYNESI